MKLLKIENLLSQKKIKMNNKSEDYQLFKDVIFPKVMKMEGGGKLHKLKGDSGGWTLWGIAFNFWSHLFDDFNDFKDTTIEEASAFAYDKFYLPIKANLVPKEAKLYYFDMAYNMGAKRAIMIMQKCIGVKADGVIGKITISKMHLLDKVCMRCERDLFYHSLAGGSERFKRFLKGWLNRSKSIFEYEY